MRRICAWLSRLNTGLDRTERRSASHKVFCWFFAVFLSAMPLGEYMCNSAFAAEMGQKIADKAKELAWPEGASVGEYRFRPTDAFVQATGRVNSDLNNTDCLSF
ncbi:hypothetical protein IIY66_02300, partial [Candidatus Saccharibacteria bacterium]|nr:hypothetical protein [Candidatus Saccharibacteria bacterium]